MSAQVKVLQKGKITIPAEIREALGVEEGDYLIVELQKGKVVMFPSGSLPNPTEAISGLAFGASLREPVDEEIKKASASRVKRKLERSGR